MSEDVIREMREENKALIKAMSEFLRGHDKSKNDEGKSEVDRLAGLFEKQNDKLVDLAIQGGESTQTISQASDVLVEMRQSLIEIANTYGVTDDVTQNTLRNFGNNLEQMIEQSQAFLDSQTISQLDDAGLKTYSTTLKMIANMRDLQAQVTSMTSQEVNVQDPFKGAEKPDDLYAEAAKKARENEKEFQKTSTLDLPIATPEQKPSGKMGMGGESAKKFERKEDSGNSDAQTSPSTPAKDDKGNWQQDKKVQSAVEKAQKQQQEEKPAKESPIRVGAMKMLKALGLSDEDAKKHVTGLSDSVAQGAAAALRGEIVSQNQAALQQDNLKKHEELQANKNGAKPVSMAEALGGSLAEITMIREKIGVSLGNTIGNFVTGSIVQPSVGIPDKAPVRSQEAPTFISPR